MGDLFCGPYLCVTMLIQHTSSCSAVSKTTSYCILLLWILGLICLTISTGESFCKTMSHKHIFQIFLEKKNKYAACINA